MDRSVPFALAMVVTLALGCTADSSGTDSPQGEFWTRLQALCGQTLAGQVHEIPAGEEGFSDVSLSLSRCSGKTIEADLFVDGRVREVWTITRNPDSLVLSHRDFAIGDGRFLIYGGSTETPGTASTQVFPADEASRSLLEAFRTNVWTVQFLKGHQLVYRLDRATKSPFFELRFDLP